MQFVLILKYIFADNITSSRYGYDISKEVTCELFVLSQWFSINELSINLENNSMYVIHRFKIIDKCNNYNE